MEIPSGFWYDIDNKNNALEGAMDKRFEIERLLDGADEWTVNRVYIFTMELIKKRKKMQKKKTRRFDERNPRCYNEEKSHYGGNDNG